MLGQGDVLARYLVLNVVVFEKATRGYRLHRAACALAGGPVGPGKDISAAFWEDGESHRQRSLLYINISLKKFGPTTSA